MPNVEGEDSEEDWALWGLDCMAGVSTISTIS